MRFWETISAFRDDPETLRSVLDSEKWHTPYGDWNSHFDEYVRRQDQQILDALLPIELTREIAARYHKIDFYFYPKLRILRMIKRDSLPNQRTIEMTALEVHDQFGGSVIEEVLEYGSAYITTKGKIFFSGLGE